tara:strand:+ start:1117 stop:1242 length:126 start_codon:yes stop_codon:yes gene_type:complete
MTNKEHLREIKILIKNGKSLGEWGYRIPKIEKHLKEIEKQL